MNLDNLKGICVNITGDCFVPEPVGVESYEDDLSYYGLTVLNDYKKEILVKAGVPQDLHEQELKLSTVELLEKYPQHDQEAPYIRRNLHTHCLVADIAEVTAKGYDKLLETTGISDAVNPADNQTSHKSKVSLNTDNPMFKEDSFGTAYLIEVNNDEITVMFEKEFFTKISIFNLKLERTVEEILGTEHRFLSLTFPIKSLTSLLRHYGHTDIEEYSGVFELEFTRAVARAIAQYYYDNKTLDFYLAMADSKSLIKSVVSNIAISNHGLQNPSAHLTQMTLNDLL